MTEMKWIPSMTAKVFLIAVLGISGSVLALADDDGHESGMEGVPGRYAEVGSVNERSPG